MPVEQLSFSSNRIYPFPTMLHYKCVSQRDLGVRLYCARLMIVHCVEWAPHSARRIPWLSFLPPKCCEVDMICIPLTTWTFCAFCGNCCSSIVSQLLLPLLLWATKQPTTWAERCFPLALWASKTTESKANVAYTHTLTLLLVPSLSDQRPNIFVCHDENHRCLK